MLTDVINLLDHHRAVLVAGLGDEPKGRHDGVVLMTEVAPREHRGGVSGHRLDDDHRGAAGGALAVVAEMARAGQTLLGHVGGVRAEIEAVLERLVPQRERREQMGEEPGHGVDLRFVSAISLRERAAWFRLSASTRRH